MKPRSQWLFIFKPNKTYRSARRYRSAPSSARSSRRWWSWACWAPNGSRPRCVRRWSSCWTPVCVRGTACRRGCRWTDRSSRGTRRCCGGCSSRFCVDVERVINKESLEDSLTGRPRNPLFSESSQRFLPALAAILRFDDHLPAINVARASLPGDQLATGGGRCRQSAGNAWNLCGLKASEKQSENQREHQRRAKPLSCSRATETETLVS